MDFLPYTAVTTGGEAYRVNFPLHPETRAPDQVADMLNEVLGSLGDIIDNREGVSDGDVLQALTMAIAIRAKMVKAPLSASEQLLGQLLGDALEAVEEATPQATGHA